MACEFLYNPIQEVALNAPILFDTSIPCSRGYVYHEGNTGNFILKGASGNSCCNQFAQYQVTFNGNIALPAEAEVGPISVALAIDWEPVQTSRAIVTPADTATDPVTQTNFFNVTSTAIITVPKGCCFTVAVENTSGPAEPGGVAPEILVQNANLTVARIA